MSHHIRVKSNSFFMLRIHAAFSGNACAFVARLYLQGFQLKTVGLEPYTASPFVCRVLALQICGVLSLQ